MRAYHALLVQSCAEKLLLLYSFGLDKFFAWFGQGPRPGFTKATVSAWRVALEARGLGAVSINVRITAVRKLAVEAADNGLLARNWPADEGGTGNLSAVAGRGVDCCRRCGARVTASQMGAHFTNCTRRPWVRTSQGAFRRVAKK